MLTNIYFCETGFLFSSFQKHNDVFGKHNIDLMLYGVKNKDYNTNTMK